MARNPGSVVDTEGRRVFERDRIWYPLERFATGTTGLYYARPIANSEDFRFHERWLLPAESWSLSRFTFHEHFKDRVDWYIETDAIDASGPLWRISDCYLDVAVTEGARYQVWDADELAEGLTRAEITLEEASRALVALDKLCRALVRNGYSGSALLAEFAPDLPR